MLALVLLFCYEIDIVSEASQPAAVSTPGNSSCLSSDLLEQLKAQLPESLFASVTGKLNAYANELEYSKLKIQLLEEKLRLQRIAKYGPGSEKLSNLQLELLEFEPGVSNTEVAAESERNALPPTPEKKKRRKHPGRQTLPADLPRVERVIACTPDSRGFCKQTDMFRTSVAWAARRSRGPHGRVFVRGVGRWCMRRVGAIIWRKKLSGIAPQEWRQREPKW